MFNINITKNIIIILESKIKMTIAMQKKKLEKKLKSDQTINFGSISITDKDISVELIRETLKVKYNIRLGKGYKRRQYVDFIRKCVEDGKFTMEEFITNAFRVAHVDFDDEEDYSEEEEENYEGESTDEEDKKPSGDDEEAEDKKPSGDEDVKKADDDDVDEKVAAWINSSITVFPLSYMGMQSFQVHPDMVCDVLNHVKPEETDESESDADAVELKALRDCVQAEVREDADVVEMDAVIRALDVMCIHDADAVDADADAEDAEDPDA